MKDYHLEDEKYVEVIEVIDLLKATMNDLKLYEGDLPEEIRYELIRLAGSDRDYILWITKHTDDGTYWKALEVETGISKEGVTPREACETYFKRTGY